MKSFVIAVVLAFFVVSGSMIYTLAIDNVAQNMADINHKVLLSLENNDFTQADRGIDELKKYINKKSTLMEAMGNHEDLDEIKITVFELEKYTEGKSSADALSKCAVLDFLFEHLPESYHVKSKNIL